MTQSPACTERAQAPACAEHAPLEPGRGEDAFRPSSTVASREFAAYASKLGLEVTSKVTLNDVLEAEVAAAGGKVSRAQMSAAFDRARRARDLRPARQAAAFGTNRLTDAKIPMRELLEKLVDAAVSRPSHFDAIQGALESPSARAKPDTLAELAAALIDYIANGNGASAQIGLGEQASDALEAFFTEKNVDVARVMGGAGGFCANLGAALPNVRSRLLGPDLMSRAQGERFNSSVETLSAEGKAVELGQLVSDSARSRTNYAIQVGPGESYNLNGRSSLRIDGQNRPIESTASGRIILGSPSHDSAGLGPMSDEALRQIADDHDIIFLAGQHYFTKASPEECKRLSSELASQLRTLKAQNPALVRHHQYVIPKVAAHDATMLGELVGAFDSMSLNSVEIPGLLERMREGKLSHGSLPLFDDRDDQENVGNVLRGILEIKEGLALERVHIHALAGDVMVVDAVTNPERHVLAALRSRQLVSMKSANATGEIKTGADIWHEIAPIVRGPLLAEMGTFADALQEKLGLDETTRAKIVEDWYYVDPESGTGYFFVPSRGIHDFTGGTVSAGDTIDASTLMHAIEPGRGRTLLHPSAFR